MNYKLTYPYIRFIFVLLVINSIKLNDHNNKNNNNNNNNNVFVCGQSRIVGGTIITNSNLYPYHVLSKSGFLCGGTLIWKDIVLTAAHCVTAYAVNTPVCVGGNTRTCTTSLDRKVIQVIQHPLYSTKTQINDIMLVKLNKTSSGPYATLNFNPSLSISETTIIGYGQIAENGALSAELQTVDVPVMNYTFCSTYWIKFGYPVNNDAQICTGSILGGKDSCGGDSGGPIFLKGTQTQVAVTSYGNGCGRANAPSINTRISGYKQWIQTSICSLSKEPPSTCFTSAPARIPSRAPQTPTKAPFVDSNLYCYLVCANTICNGNTLTSKLAYNAIYNTNLLGTKDLSIRCDINAIVTDLTFSYSDVIATSTKAPYYMRGYWNDTTTLIRTINYLHPITKKTINVVAKNNNNFVSSTYLQFYIDNSTKTTTRNNNTASINTSINNVQKSRYFPTNVISNIFTRLRKGYN